MNIEQQIEAARAEVRKHKFGTAAYDAAFDAMRALTTAAASVTRETFCSVDSGWHKTRTLDGGVV